MLLLIALLFTSLNSFSHAASERFLTGSKTLEITDYSIVKKGIISGNYIQSDTFTVGGNQWAIDFYPQGWNSSYSDSISIFVRIKNATNAASAMFTHRLQNWKSSSWSTDTPSSTNILNFSTSGFTSWGYYNYMKHSNFESSSYLMNDALVIKTTLWVVNSSTLLLPTASALQDIPNGGNSDQQDFMSARDVPPVSDA